MSLNIVDPTTGQTTKVAGKFDTTPIEAITEQLTASDDTPFRFGYDSVSGKYGYIIEEGGADTVIPFKTTGTRSGAITSNGTYIASADISEDGYESVVVDVPNSVQTKTVTAGTADVTVSPDSGYIGMSSVTVSPTPSQTKTVTSSRSAQTVTPDSGKLLSSVTVNALAPTGTYTASSRGASLDMGATSNYRYVNTNGVPNSNTETYTFPANDTGGTKDLGATNNYRYVNAGNVYNKGKADGGSGKVTVSVSNVLGQDLKVNRIVSFSATVGAVYAVAFGGRDAVPTSMPTSSGCTALDYHYQIIDGRGYLCALAIVQATSTTVSITVYSSTKEVGCIVTRITS